MGFFDMFSGGALSRVAIFALGIMPYISASIIFQLLTVVIPAIGKLAKRGRGRQEEDYKIYEIRNSSYCGNTVFGNIHRS